MCLLPRGDLVPARHALVSVKRSGGVVMSGPGQRTLAAAS
jgi:hypothetical protein